MTRTMNGDCPMRWHVGWGRVFVLGLMAPLLLIVWGCAGLPQDIIDEANGHSKEFVIGPEDVLEVTVWRNADLSREVVVRPDGMISLPLIGDILARGRTADELAQAIKDALTAFKENPQVSVSVKQVNSYIIYVLGEVNQPGKFQLKSRTTVLQAIALAGGFTQFASRNNLQVIRNGLNGSEKPGEMRIPVSYDDAVDGDGEIGNLLLKSGDTLVVP